MNQMTIYQQEPGFGLLLKSGQEYHIDPDFLQTMIECYPNIDHQKEIREMKAWLVSNPERRKTKRGMKRFINHWFSKSKPKEKGFVEKHTNKTWREGM